MEPLQQVKLNKPKNAFQSTRKKASRRLAQRRKQRLIKINTVKDIHSNVGIARNNHTEQYCLRNFGFCANPTASKSKNFKLALHAKPSHLWLQPRNLAFHNLCKTQHLPLGTKELLGLNLKFCLSSGKITNDIKKTVIQMARSIRTRIFLATNGTTENNIYERQIYIKNTSWNPPPAPLYIEDKITEFDKTLKLLHQRLNKVHKHKKLTNLTPLQVKTLKELKMNKEITIKPTDKNLGPAVLDTDHYINQALKEHLLTPAYKQLSHLEVTRATDNIKASLKELIQSNSQLLSKAELTYFERSLRTYHRLPIFYGLPKVHKQPFSLRPVVSTSGSLLAIFSTWLDFKMKELIPLVKSYFKNSFTVIEELKALTIPSNALFFSADAISMYTNIDTTTGLNAMKNFIQSNRDHISSSFSCDLFLQVLRLVIQNNIISFADTYWLQLSGTAMGTPVACAYATVTFGHYENTTILPEFAPQLLYYKRYIDDIIGIWLPPPFNQTTTWDRFQESLNNWGNLQWKCEVPSRKTTFLDLELELHNSSVITKTFQKEMNLYLYIPPLSAHPPSCLKGLITGELRRYWLQNNKTDFQHILIKFIERLTERGHTIESLTPIFEQAALLLDKTPKIQANSTTDNDSTLFLHRTYHPYGLSRCTIRNVFQQILDPVLDYDRMIIATARPTNLRDLLTKAHLTMPDNTAIQDYIDLINGRN